VPTILLLRHAQASFGTADYDVLSALGERQVQALDAELERRGTTIDHAASGTMRRQRDTLAGLSRLPTPTPTPTVDPGLDEYSADDILAAHTTSALRQDRPGDAQLAATGDTPEERAAASVAFQDVLDDGLRAWIAAGAGGPAAEPFPMFAGRVRAAVEKTGRRLSSGQTALLCTSSGVISAACTILLGLPDEAFIAFNRVTVNTGLTTIALGRRGATLVSFNEHGHLVSGGRSLLSYR
jgi:broad specificity phosphatase PhoE